MWATKLFAKGEDRKTNPTPVPEAVEVFREILRKRVHPQLIEPEVTQMLILRSGGALRELIRLASRCCQLCLVQLRPTPDNQDIVITEI